MKTNYLLVNLDQSEEPSIYSTEEEVLEEITNALDNDFAASLESFKLYIIKNDKIVEAKLEKSTIRIIYE